MIGMSLYPYWAEQQGETGGWMKVADDCIANINHLKQKYNKPVMICEIGMPYDQPEPCKQLIAKMMNAPVEGYSTGNHKLPMAITMVIISDVLIMTHLQ